MKVLNYGTRKMTKKNSQQCHSQKTILFTSAGRPPFIGRQTNFLHTEINESNKNVLG
jgi:hypothetical protein